MNNQEIPTFDIYFPSELNMDKKQYGFYQYLENGLKKGNYIDIDGNISYLFVYIYKQIRMYKEYGFQRLSEYLIYLSELYANENKIRDYCLSWAYDCLLGLKNYDEYLNKTEPESLTRTATHSSNLRLNIQKHLGMSAYPVDLLLLFGGRKTKFIVNNQSLYKAKILDIFDEYEKENGSFFNIIENDSNTYQHSLFNGIPMNELIYMDLPIKSFYTNYNGNELVKKLSKNAENLARETLGVPKIGEGWISETELFRKIEAAFPQTLVIQHGQPTWLGRQHFDIWLPNWNIAIEYHGKQHFEPVEFFGGQEAFEKNVQRDNKKIHLAKKHGVRLFIVTEESEQDILIEDIKVVMRDRKVSLE